MTLVRFADLCDYMPDAFTPECSTRSAEYTCWPKCSECLSATCPDHMVPGTFSDDENNSCVCISCA